MSTLEGVSHGFLGEEHFKIGEQSDRCPEVGVGPVCLRINSGWSRMSKGQDEVRGAMTQTSQGPMGHCKNS